MKPKILLLNLPGRHLYVRDYFCSKISKADYINAPIDLVMISGVLNTGEFELFLIDAIVEKLSPKKCLEKIVALSPDKIIALLGSASFEEDKVFLKNLAQSFSGEIFAIGDILLTEGKKFLEENPFIKGVILNFISKGIYWYLKGNLGAVSDLMLNENSEIKIYPSSRPAEFEINLPIQEKFIKRNYRIPFVRRWPFATTLLSYGCPYACSFCIMNTLGYVPRGLDNIFLELDYLKSLGVREIFFLDQTLGVDGERFGEFLRRLIEKKYGFGWFGFTRVDLVDEEKLKLMKEAGCHTLWFGVESASDEILKQYKKGYSKEQVQRAFQIAKKVGIKTLATFLIGLPEETKDMIEETIRFAKKLDPDFVSFNFAVPRFGTPLREEAIKRNLIAKDENIMDQSGYKITMGTHALDRKEVQKLKRKAIVSFYFRPNYLLKRLLALRSLTEFKLHLKNFYSLIRNEF